MGRVWRCLLEKACAAVIGVLRVTLLRAQKRGAAERALSS